MNLYDFVSTDPQNIITEAFKHPVMRIKPRAANPYPSIDDALRATVNAIEYQTIYTVAEKVRPLLEDILLNAELIDGAYDEVDDKTSWEAAVDDQVEAAIEDYVPVLSADWLGNHTIGSGLWEKDGVEKFVMSMGREMYKQLTHGKTPVQIMSAAGVVRADVEARLAIHNQPKEEKTMTETKEELEAVIQKVAEYVGKDYDVMTVYDDFDLASDDDEGLAEGAGARLGLEAEDVEWLQMERLEHGDDTAQKLVDMLDAAVKGTKKKPAKKAAAKAEKPAAKPKAKAKDEDAAAAAEGGVSADSLQKLKEACTFKDADVAQRLGVSRATFNNWVNGKTACDLGGEQYTTLRDEVVGRINLLHECLAELDGTEAQVVF